jgi:hypothetical protein
MFSLISIYIPEDIEIFGSTDQIKLKPGVAPHINLWYKMLTRPHLISHLFIQVL